MYGIHGQTAYGWRDMKQTNSELERKIKPWKTQLQRPNSRLLVRTRWEQRKTMRQLSEVRTHFTCNVAQMYVCAVRRRAKERRPWWRRTGRSVMADEKNSDRCIVPDRHVMTSTKHIHNKQKRERDSSSHTANHWTKWRNSSLHSGGYAFSNSISLLKVSTRHSAAKSSMVASHDIC